MQKRFVRTLVILVSGIAMALVAYAGQMGYNDEGSLESFRFPRGDSIHISIQDGFMLDYRLLAQQDSSSSDSSRSPELVLCITGERQRLVDEASVIYRIIGPRGTEVQAQALSVLGCYEADIFWDAPGRYQVTTEIRTARGTFNDRFDHAML